MSRVIGFPFHFLALPSAHLRFLGYVDSFAPALATSHKSLRLQAA